MESFKVWCKNKNEWEKDSCILKQNGEIYQENIRVPLRKDTHIFVPPTGVKDINKKDAYLGDILKEPIYSWTSEEKKKEIEEEYTIVKKEKNSNNMYLEYNYKYAGEWRTAHLTLSKIAELEIKGNVYQKQENIKKEV